MSHSLFKTLIIATVLAIGPSLLAQDEPIAEAVANQESKVTSEANSQPKARPITVSVGLVDDSTTITGTLTETTSLNIKTAFGIAELPLNEVAGVRFPRGDDSSTTVVMLNGDSITGATDLKFVNVETSWGSAKINGPAIAGMMMVPGLSWQSIDVLGSKRWQLVEAPRTPALPPNNTGRTPTSLPSTNPGSARPNSGTSTTPGTLSLPSPGIPSR